ncbi:MAG TPA: HD-GYP domain-containing protein [Vicinamibacterales bacterium]|nr:HD-GYP domain-containing protein [Vicinamibacterales bacterium]
MKRLLPAAFKRVNTELWVVLSLFVIALLLNQVIAAQRMVLSFFVLPTIASAYFYGRRHGTLTAFASVLLVVGLLIFRNSTMTETGFTVGMAFTQWLEVAVWGGSLVITGYLMGTLYEHKNLQINELRETYQGVLMILRHFISKDAYTENHCYRVSVYATRIAAQLNLPTDRIEDIRAAALLHDIGKLDISRDLLYKAAKLTRDEYETVQQHVPRGIEMLEPVGGALRRVIPIILSHHDKFDGSGYNPTSGESIPLESRIIAVADVYDALTSDRPYRKAMSTFEARDIITNGAETEFDPKVIAAFNALFKRGELEIWSAPLSAA